MPLLFFILLIVLIAQVGFWDTLGAILGAALMIGLLVVLIVAIVIVGGLFLAKRLSLLKGGVQARNGTRR